MKKCLQCGKEMNPVEFLLGPVCGQCCRDNHKKAAGLLKRAADCIQSFLDDMGGCDHSVGICACADVRLVEELRGTY